MGRPDDVDATTGVQLPEVAIQFPLRHPAVVSVPLGVGTAEEVAENARRCAIPIPEEMWAELEDLNRTSQAENAP